MFKTSGLFLIVTSFFLVAPPPASAEIFFWQDVDTKLSVTYPDRWHRVHNQKSDDLFTVAAPGESDQAVCRLRVNDDRRFAIYPSKFARNVQHVAVSYDFWENYVNEYTGAVLSKVSDDAGLGRGFASFAEASYVTSTGPKMQKRGLMFASLYGNKLYVLDCSAEASAYGKWYKSFLSVAKSVNFRKAVAISPSGYYRDFVADPRLEIHGVHHIDTVYY